MSEISQDINALVQADIDGTITPEERSRLEQLLESREDVRDFHAGCERLARALDDLESLDPPPGLDDSILAAIQGKADAESEAGAEEGQGGWRGLLDLWFRYPVLRYAAAFLVGAILTSLLQGRGDGRSDLQTASLAGTMSPPPEFKLIDTRRLEAAGVDLRLNLLRADELLQLRFDIDSATPLTLQVRYLPQGYRLFGFSQRQGTLSGLNADDGELALRVTGEHGFDLFLVAGDGDGKGKDIDLLLSRGGEVLETLRLIPGV